MNKYEVAWFATKQYLLDSLMEHLRIGDSDSEDYIFKLKCFDLLNDMQDKSEKMLKEKGD